jgi:hypothetical protein
MHSAGYLHFARRFLVFSLRYFSARAINEADLHITISVISA